MIYEYICDACGRYHERYGRVEDCDNPIICNCGEYANRAICTAPAITGTDTWSDTKFTPHYDEQLGQYFSTKEGRKSYLKGKDIKELTDNPQSPEGDQPSRPKMSRTQAMKAHGTAIKHNS